MANKELVYNSKLSSKEKALALLICSAQEYQSKINLLLKKYNISLTQVTILHILDEMPKTRFTVGEIKAAMIEDSPNVSRALKKLQDKGYIRKVRDNNDQRIVYISISKLGSDMHIKCDKELSKISINLSSEESETLAEILRKI